VFITLHTGVAVACVCVANLWCCPNQIFAAICTFVQLCYR